LLYEDDDNYIDINVDINDNINIDIDELLPDLLRLSPDFLLVLLLLDLPMVMGLLPDFPQLLPDLPMVVLLPDMTAGEEGSVRTGASTYSAAEGDRERGVRGHEPDEHLFIERSDTIAFIALVKDSLGTNGFSRNRGKEEEA